MSLVDSDWIGRVKETDTSKYNAKKQIYMKENEMKLTFDCGVLCHRPLLGSSILPCNNGKY